MIWIRNSKVGVVCLEVRALWLQCEGAGYLASYRASEVSVDLPFAITHYLTPIFYHSTPTLNSPNDDIRRTNETPPLLSQKIKLTIRLRVSPNTPTPCTPPTRHCNLFLFLFSRSYVSVSYFLEPPIAPPCTPTPAHFGLLRRSGTLEHTHTLELVQRSTFSAEASCI